MGLAASQARLLLLTAKNDALELAAQKIENERLMLAQEQEQIATDYSEKTTNTIMTCRMTDETGETVSETMTLDSLTRTMGLNMKTNGEGEDGAKGKIVVIADAAGNPLVGARLEGGKVVYYDKNGDEIKDSDNSPIIQALNTKENGSFLQNQIAAGALQLYVENQEATIGGTQTLFGGNANSGLAKLTQTHAQPDGEDVPNGFVRKATESLSGVTSRYYTEDDAAAQAEYNTQMARVNALDQRLENKLNQVETQKKSIEQEIESSDQLISSNIERTFKYFS